MVYDSVHMALLLMQNVCRVKDVGSMSKLHGVAL